MPIPLAETGLCGGCGRKSIVYVEVTHASGATGMPSQNEKRTCRDCLEASQCNLVGDSAVRPLAEHRKNVAAAPLPSPAATCLAEETAMSSRKRRDFVACCDTDTLPIATATLAKRPRESF